MFKINIADSKERPFITVVFVDMKPYFFLKYLVHVVNAKRNEDGLIDLKELQIELDDKIGLDVIGKSLTYVWK